MEFLFNLFLQIQTNFIFTCIVFRYYVIEIEFPRPFACPFWPDEKELVSAKFIVCPLGNVYVWVFDNPDAPCIFEIVIIKISQ